MVAHLGLFTFTSKQRQNFGIGGLVATVVVK